MITITITLANLQAHDACRERANLFARLYPDGVSVTAETVRQAHDAGLQVGWIVGRLIPVADALPIWQAAWPEGGAHMRNAYLKDAHMRNAYLKDAYLKDAHLWSADLGGADLRGAIGLPEVPA